MLLVICPKVSYIFFLKECEVFMFTYILYAAENLLSQLINPRVSATSITFLFFLCWGRSFLAHILQVTTGVTDKNLNGSSFTLKVY
jgi:hypothetical protein